MKRKGHVWSCRNKEKMELHVLHIWMMKGIYQSHYMNETNTETETQMMNDDDDSQQHSWVCPLRHRLWDLLDMLFCAESDKFEISPSTPMWGSSSLFISFLSLLIHFALWFTPSLFFFSHLEATFLGKTSLPCSCVVSSGLVLSMWESESESGAGREYGSGLLTSTKHSVKTEGFQQRGNSWYVVQCSVGTIVFNTWLKIK